MGRKPQYDALLADVQEIVSTSLDRKEKLTRICELLWDDVAHYDWVGFYLVEHGKLVLGPFMGEPTEHVKISFGEGICGQAAEREETVVVQNVSEETNYLSCSPQVQSEIVIPLFKDGTVVGELDIDSHTRSPFTKEDRTFLEAVARHAATLF